jgi:threonine dehydratase
MAFLFAGRYRRKGKIMPVTLHSIRAARERIRGHIYLSPARHSAGLSEMTGQQVFLKLDNLQRTGAFKERGALNKILTLTDDERRRGVIAASAGNHAQAVAFHAGQRGIRARIVMPLMTPLVKVAATSNYGADVVLYGADYDEACAEAIRQSSADGLTFLHPFDDDEVIAGQGTIGLELLEQVPDLESRRRPHRRRRAHRRRRLRYQGEPSENPRHRRPNRAPPLDAASPRGRPSRHHPRRGHHCRRHRCPPRRGKDPSPLSQSTSTSSSPSTKRRSPAPSSCCWNARETLAEGAGAAALAALLQKKTDLNGDRTAVLVCGGNIDVTLLSKIIERGLVKDGRRTRVRIHLTDRPGALHQLTKIIADLRANIVQTAHDRAYYGVSLGDTVIDFTLETRGATHIEEIRAALTEAGYRHERIE